MSVRRRILSSGVQKFQVYVFDRAAGRQLYVGTFDRKKDAVEAEYEAKRRLRLGERLKPREEIAFEALSERWMDGLVTVRHATREDYRKAIDRMRPFFGKNNVSRISRRDIDDMITHLSRRYAPSTVRKTVTIMKMILRTGIDWGYIDAMPAGQSRLSLPKVKKRRFEPLTTDQVSLLVSCAPKYWQPFVLFLLTTGLRRAEAFGLTEDCLDLEQGCVHVRRQLVKGRLVELKTDAGHRRVPLPRQTVEALREHLRVRPTNELDLVFPSPEGRPVDMSNFYSRVWIPTREKAGLPEFRMHDARHHVATLMLSQGLSIKYVQTVLGHSTASVLLDIYAHVAQGEEDRASAEMERWLGEEEMAAYGTFRVPTRYRTALRDVYQLAGGGSDTLRRVAQSVAGAPRRWVELGGMKYGWSILALVANLRVDHARVSPLGHP